MKTIGETLIVQRIPSDIELKDWNGDFVSEMRHCVGLSGKVIYVSEDSSYLNINGMLWWFPNICFDSDKNLTK